MRGHGVSVLMNLIPQISTNADAAAAAARGSRPAVRSGGSSRARRLGGSPHRKAAGDDQDHWSISSCKTSCHRRWRRSALCDPIMVPISCPILTTISEPIIPRYHPSRIVSDIDTYHRDGLISGHDVTDIGTPDIVSDIMIGYVAYDHDIGDMNILMIIFWISRHT